MQLITTASWAELLEFQPTRIVSPILFRSVVTLAALSALHRNYRAVSLRLLRHYTSSFLGSPPMGELVRSRPETPAPPYFTRYSSMLVTTPAPTVRPPSRIANRNPSSIATGVISSTPICTLSPGI